jgi:hypothetical protein
MNANEHGLKQGFIRVQVVSSALIELRIKRSSGEDRQLPSSTPFGKR